MNTPKYWTGIEELETPSKITGNNNNAPGDGSIEGSLVDTSDDDLGFSTNRRDFLKLFGFGLTAATLVACNETPIKKAISFVDKPDDLVPGVPNYYSSTCAGCSAGCGVMVKTREGRPIKVEGNPDSKISQGALCAVGQSTVLNLYDIDRLKKAQKGKADAEWATVDNEIMSKLNGFKGKGSVRVLSSTIISPSTLSVINDFITLYGGLHVTYDAVSYYGIARAHELNFDKLAIPSYHFDKADVVVSFGADFLGTWLSPVQFAKDYTQNRNIKSGKMSRHFQVESLLSTTGAVADVRLPINPSQEGAALMNLYNKVAKALGKPEMAGAPAFNVAGNQLDRMATELAAAAGRSLVVSGSNDIAIQQIVNGINAMLGNYGTTVDLANPSYQKQGNDAALSQLMADIAGGKVDALIVYGANPVYDTPYGKTLEAAIARLPLSVSFATKADETSLVCQYTCPDSHEMESWNDANPIFGQFSINQPTINTIYSTRQAQQSLLKWTGNNVDYLAYIKANWAKNITGSMTATQWDDILRVGVYHKEPNAAAAAAIKTETLSAAASALAGKSAKGGLEVVLFEKVAIRDGKHANNPWLQEMPDPISRTVWDGYATVSVAFAKEKGLKDNDIIEIKVGDKTLKLPAIHQPGQAKDTIGIALGYGRNKELGKTLSKVSGENVFPWVAFNGSNAYTLTGAAATVTGEDFPVAKFQKYDLLDDPTLASKWDISGNGYNRTHHIVRESTLEKYVKNPKAGNEERDHTKKHLITLWDSHYKEENANQMIRWVMAIDLNKCTGCGACVVACNAENNVPVVGKKEIMTHRDMHWMRIDRYYSGDLDAAENVSVVFQPMMCQHCANAPCETVCPVLATVHTSDGLNSMAYNRCVGTRYCANNCPYKVRRFNWFKYHNNDNFDFNQNNPLGKLVLNPDVTVRFRGVMEKCSFCVQRLQEGKLRAKVNAKQVDAGAFAKPKDGDIKTACQQTCPTGAIVFGDLNDPESEVSKLFRDDRAFTVLEEVKTLPSVSYLTRIRNQKADEVKGNHSEEHGEHKEAAHEEKKPA